MLEAPENPGNLQKQRKHDRKMNRQVGQIRFFLPSQPAQEKRPPAEQKDSRNPQASHEAITAPNRIIPSVQPDIESDRQKKKSGEGQIS